MVPLRLMLEAAYVCWQFIEGRTRSELDDDLMFYYAVAKAVELIGETAWQVSKTALAEHPEIAWDDIIGMRHHLVHGFEKIVRDTLWTVAQQDVPILISQLQVALAQAEN